MQEHIAEDAKAEMVFIQIRQERIYELHPCSSPAAQAN